MQIVLIPAPSLPLFVSPSTESCLSGNVSVCKKCICIGKIRGVPRLRSTTNTCANRCALTQAHIWILVHRCTYHVCTPAPPVHIPYISRTCQWLGIWAALCTSPSVLGITIYAARQQSRVKINIVSLSEQGIRIAYSNRNKKWRPDHRSLFASLPRPQMSSRNHKSCRCNEAA